jgi:hypothetical protein
VVAHEIVDVIAVRHGLVATVLAVSVTGVVAITVVPRRAVLGMRGVDLHHVLVDVIPVRVMEMTVVQVVHVVSVLNGRVTATRSVLMRVI